MNYALPTLVIATGLDGVPGHLAGDLTPACVPEGLGNKRFYDAMPGSTWMVNATAFGHGDVLDDLYYEGLVVSKHNQDSRPVKHRQKGSGAPSPWASHF